MAQPNGLNPVFESNGYSAIGAVVTAVVPD